MEEKKKKGPDGPRDVDLDNPSKSTILQIIICENPDITFEQADKELRRRGHQFNKTALRQIHSYCRRTIKVAQALGYWKDKEKGKA